MKRSSEKTFLALCALGLAASLGVSTLLASNFFSSKKSPECSVPNPPESCKTTSSRGSGFYSGGSNKSDDGTRGGFGKSAHFSGGG